LCTVRLRSLRLPNTFPTLSQHPLASPEPILAKTSRLYLTGQDYLHVDRVGSVIAPGADGIWIGAGGGTLSSSGRTQARDMLDGLMASRMKIERVRQLLPGGGCLGSRCRQNSVP
jgi:hypothetical protein